MRRGQVMKKLHWRIQAKEAHPFEYEDSYQEELVWLNTELANPNSLTSITRAKYRSTEQYREKNRQHQAAWRARNKRSK